MGKSLVSCFLTHSVVRFLSDQGHIKQAASLSVVCLLVIFILGVTAMKRRKIQANSSSGSSNIGSSRE